MRVHLLPPPSSPPLLCFVFFFSPWKVAFALSTNFSFCGSAEGDDDGGTKKFWLLVKFFLPLYIASTLSLSWHVKLQRVYCENSSTILVYFLPIILPLSFRQTSTQNIFSLLFHNFRRRIKTFLEWQERLEFAIRHEFEREMKNSSSHRYLARLPLVLCFHVSCLV